MPTYSFRCKDDYEQTTAILSIANRNDAPACAICGKPMTRIYAGGHMVIRVPNPLSRQGSGSEPRVR